MEVSVGTMNRYDRQVDQRVQTPSEVRFDVHSPRDEAVHGVQKQLHGEQSHESRRLLEDSGQHDQGQETQPGEGNHISQLPALQDTRQFHASCRD
jgi:hypothetical protein